MPYLDTSILVAALTREAETARMQAWIAAHAPGDLAISAWVATEFSAALSIKVRTGQLRASDRTRALEAFSRLAAESFVVLPIAESSFHTAARYADRTELGLRAGDALHLAVAAADGLVLATLDRKLAAAGTALELSTELV